MRSLHLPAGLVSTREHRTMNEKPEVLQVPTKVLKHHVHLVSSNWLGATSTLCGLGWSEEKNAYDNEVRHKPKQPWVHLRYYFQAGLLGLGRVEQLAYWGAPVCQGCIDNIPPLELLAHTEL